MLASVSTFDKLFSIATLSASAIQYYLFTQNESPKSKVPIQFGWWGEPGNFTENIKFGALLYPALVAGMNGLAIFSRKIVADAAAKDAQLRVKLEDALTPVQGENPLKTIWRSMGKRFLLQSFSFLTLFLQQWAYEISLGKRTKANTWFVRGIIIGYVAVTMGHYYFGTDVLLM